MEIVFSAHGHSCDLALHPVSEKTARTIQKYGSEVYSMRALEWWRKGKTATWGMRIDDMCNIQVSVDGEPVEVRLQQHHRKSVEDPPPHVPGQPGQVPLRARPSTMKYASFPGSGAMSPSTTPPSSILWFINGTRIMGEEGYYILDEIRYGNEFATSHDWCDASGFTLVPPRIIDLEEVRRELAQGGPEHIGPAFPSPLHTTPSPKSPE